MSQRWTILAVIVLAQTVANIGPLGIPAIASLIRAAIEQPEYKRRWNDEPWEEQEQRSLRGWRRKAFSSPRASAPRSAWRSGLA